MCLVFWFLNAYSIRNTLNASKMTRPNLYFSIWKQEISEITSTKCVSAYNFNCIYVFIIRIPVSLRKWNWKFVIIFALNFKRTSVGLLDMLITSKSIIIMMSVIPSTHPFFCLIFTSFTSTKPVVEIVKCYWNLKIDFYKLNTRNIVRKKIESTNVLSAVWLIV